jgi:propanol-preferring alcohol dehydrogenase
MRALRLREWGQRPELIDVPVPVPTGDEVLLRVDAAGLCHSDLHVMDAALGQLPYALPFTLGHEVVGTVVAIGDRVSPEWLGGQHAVHGIWSCGDCRQCRAGRDNHCAALTGPIGGGLGRDGGLADFMLVPAARHLVPVQGQDPVRVAPLTDAGLTAFHALRPYGDLLPGAVVVVIGVGGLGHLALQVLAASAPEAVVAVDPRAEARQLAIELGAALAVASVDEVLAALGQVAPGAGADLVIDFVGSSDTLAAARGLLAPGGQLALVGSAGGHLKVAKGADLPRGWGVAAPFWGPRNDLVQVVAMAGAGTLNAETESFTLDEALTAYERLRAGDVRGRAVVVPTLTT